MDPGLLVETLLWLAVAGYALGSVLFVFRARFSSPALASWAWFLTLAGFCLHVAAVLYRWHLVGHGPYRTIHEILVCDSAFVVGGYLLVAWHRERLRLLGGLVVPLALLMMGFGLMADRAGAYLSPSLKSPWLAVHVLFAKAAVGSVAAATGLAAGFLLRKRRILDGLVGRLPDDRRLVEISRKLLEAAFVFASLMIIAGAIWANDAWGRYWDWDPIETWSLIVWVVYGLVLHLRHGWKLPDQVFALLVVAALLVSIVAFFLVPFGVESIHSQYFQ